MSEHMHIEPEKPWLGGFLRGGDPDTIYEDMWNWLVETWEVKSVIDVGCGDGYALNYFRELGCAVLGVEGVPQDDPNIVQHDYEQGPYRPDRQFDLAWSAEFLEHVEEQYIPNFMETFKAARFVLVTHGEPGQPGWHHVDNQPGDFWKGAFSANGFQFDEGLTAQTRALASNNTRPFNHYRRSGLAFRRRT
jgi:SAM-dependent methyltransferase